MRTSALPLLVALSAPLAAQNTSAEFSPNPAPPGVQIDFVATDATGSGLFLPSGCTWLEVRQGSPSGPVIDHLPQGTGCGAALVPIAANGSFGVSWNQIDTNTGLQVAPGTYWYRVSTLADVSSPIVQEWFCISIQDPSDPTLRALTPAKAGQALALDIVAPTEPGAAYVTVASFTSNNPIVLTTGLPTCIDQDSLFSLSFPVPNPAVFTGFQGTLDAFGTAAGISVAIPASPVVNFQPLVLQAAVIGGPGGLRLTNAQSFTVQP